MKYPEPLLKLMAHLRRLPGVGKKSAERFAFQILSWKERDLQEFAKTLSHLKNNLHTCCECGSLYDQGSCFFCSSPLRDKNSLCIVASQKDIFTIESTGVFNGLYHVVSGLLSPLSGMGPHEISFDFLKERIENLKIREVIIALDSTLEGDATALFLKKELTSLSLSISRLSVGMPLGSSLDFLDEGTLSKAFASRAPV